VLAGNHWRRAGGLSGLGRNAMPSRAGTGSSTHGIERGSRNHVRRFGPRSRTLGRRDRRQGPGWATYGRFYRPTHARLAGRRIRGARDEVKFRVWKSGCPVALIPSTNWHRTDRHDADLHLELVRRIMRASGCSVPISFSCSRGARDPVSERARQGLGSLLHSRDRCAGFCISFDFLALDFRNEQLVTDGAMRSGSEACIETNIYSAVMIV